jgi:signal peptidase I
VISSLASIADARRARALRRANRGGGGRWPLLRLIWEWGRTAAIAIVLFVAIRSLVVEAFTIPTGSMERTLLAGDFLLVNKLAFGAEVPFTRHRLPALGQPRVRDVIVFRWPVDPRMHFIKRLVGLPGDTLAMRRGVLYRNSLAQAEPYAQHSTARDPEDGDFLWQLPYVIRSPGASGDIAEHPSRNNWGPLIVPQHSYFVLGDNRDNSLDSRYWGFVPDSLLGGRPLVVYYSYDPDTARPFAWLTRIRWRRIGERVD